MRRWVIWEEDDDEIVVLQSDRKMSKVFMKEYGL